MFTLNIKITNIHNYITAVVTKLKNPHFCVNTINREIKNTIIIIMK